MNLLVFLKNTMKIQFLRITQRKSKNDLNTQIKPKIHWYVSEFTKIELFVLGKDETVNSVSDPDKLKDN